MRKTIAFDMDGTFVNLYGVKGWLEMIINKETTPYEIAEPLYNMNDFNAMVETLKANGYKVIIISWTAKGNDKEYNKRIRQAKVSWLKNHNVNVDEIHVVKYGTPKSYLVKGNAILVDDEETNRKSWIRGNTINATKNILKEIKKVLDI